MIKVREACSKALDYAPFITMHGLTKKNAVEYLGYIKPKFYAEIRSPSVENDLTRQKELYSLRITKYKKEKNA
ncbi:Uncharacterised protein [uncultured archaeon]|nr:Uncharacterised protein [uncultured archaeon]